jgi:lipoprotein-releasing system ATP-binding protein
VLVVENISKTFTGVGKPLRILDDVSLSLAPGQSAAIVGPSGSGKTTLLQILGTLDSPDQGTVQINDTDPFSLDEKRRAAFRNQTIGFVFQDHHLLPQLSVIENVLIPALAVRTANDDDVKRAETLIEAVGLGERTTHLPGELSGGERERVAIARALLMRPTLILADEPTGNLDARTATGITELLLRLQADENAVLITVTHSQALAEAMSCQFELTQGRLVERAPA